MGGRLCTGRAIEGINTAASNEDAFFLAAGENDWKSARLALTKAKKKAQLESVRALALDTEPVMFAFAKAHLMGLKGHFDENFDFVKNELFSGDADISHYKGAMVHALLSNLDPEKLVSDAADRETVVMLSEAQANGAAAALCLVLRNGRDIHAAKLFDSLSSAGINLEEALKENSFLFLNYLESLLRPHATVNEEIDGSILYHRLTLTPDMSSGGLTSFNSISYRQKMEPMWDRICKLIPVVTADIITAMPQTAMLDNLVRTTPWTPIRETPLGATLLSNLMASFQERFSRLNVAQQFKLAAEQSLLSTEELAQHLAFLEKRTDKSGGAPLLAYLIKNDESGEVIKKLVECFPSLASEVTVLSMLLPGCWNMLHTNGSEAIRNRLRQSGGSGSPKGRMCLQECIEAFRTLNQKRDRENRDSFYECLISPREELLDFTFVNGTVPGAKKGHSRLFGRSTQVVVVSADAEVPRGRFGKIAGSKKNGTFVVDFGEGAEVNLSAMRPHQIRPAHSSTKGTMHIGDATIWGALCSTYAPSITYAQDKRFRADSGLHTLLTQDILNDVPTIQRKHLGTDLFLRTIRPGPTGQSIAVVNAVLKQLMEQNPSISTCIDVDETLCHLLAPIASLHGSQAFDLKEAFDPKKVAEDPAALSLLQLVRDKAAGTRDTTWIIKTGAAAGFSLWASAVDTSLFGFSRNIANVNDQKKRDQILQCVEAGMINMSEAENSLFRIGGAPQSSVEHVREILAHFPQLATDTLDPLLLRASELPDHLYNFCVELLTSENLVFDFQRLHTRLKNNSTEVILQNLKIKDHQNQENKLRVRHFVEHTKASIPPGLIVTRAWYGKPGTTWKSHGKDVTAIINEYLRKPGRGRRKIEVNNIFFRGDPAPNIKKELVIESDPQELNPFGSFLMKLENKSSEAAVRFLDCLLLRMPSLAYGSSIECCITIPRNAMNLFKKKSDTEVVATDPQFVPGARIICNWANQGTWYEGVIKEIKKGKYEIDFDDGDFESGVTANRIKLSKTWECPACTFVNRQSAQKCEICDFARPNMGKSSEYLAEKEARSIGNGLLASQNPSTLSVDPKLVQLRVRDQAIVLPEDVQRLVSPAGLNSELQRAQRIMNVEGDEICFYCDGSGMIKSDLNKISGSVNTVENQIEQSKEFAAASLPYGGDMSKAMAARDRDAIRAIMTFNRERREQGAENAGSCESDMEAMPATKLRLLRSISSDEGKEEKDEDDFRQRQGAVASSKDADDAKNRVTYGGILWFYCTIAEPIVDVEEEPLPYNGDIQAAMRNQDRAAIKQIMIAKQAKKKRLHLKRQESGESKDSEQEWKQFSSLATLSLEEAFQDGKGAQVMCFEPEMGQLRCDLGKMNLTRVDDERSQNNVFYKLKRAIQSYEEDGESNTGEDNENQAEGLHETMEKMKACWVCQGTGRTSKWMQSLTAKETMTEETEILCEVCGVDTASYGISVECEHLFCSDCISNTLKAILDLGQFPACCPVCRVQNDGQAVDGFITRPVLTFLEQRSVIEKDFQFRFVAGMHRYAERNGDDHGLGLTDRNESMLGLAHHFACPAKCGQFLIKEKPKFDIVGEEVHVRLGECPCGALVCPQCEKLHLSLSERLEGKSRHVKPHKCKRGVSKEAENALQRTINEEKASASAMAKLGKACPVCGMFIQKNEGCDYMSCGTSAHGKLSDCLTNGGCGIAFKWGTLEVCDDPCGYKDLDGSKKRGRPVTARQLANHPKCARPECTYYCSTDGMKTKHVPSGSTCGRNNGGRYCCAECRDGGGKKHGIFCHKIRHKDFDQDETVHKRTAVGDMSAVVPCKYLKGVWARSVQLRWTASSVKDRFEVFDTSFFHNRDKTFLVEFLTVDSCVLKVQNCVVNYMPKDYITTNSSRKGVPLPMTTATLAGLKVFGQPVCEYSDDEGEIVLSTLTVDFGESKRIIGIRSEALVDFPFQFLHSRSSFDQAVVGDWILYKRDTMLRPTTITVQPTSGKAAMVENEPPQLKKDVELQRSRGEEEMNLPPELKRKINELKKAYDLGLLSDVLYHKTRDSLLNPSKKQEETNQKQISPRAGLSVNFSLPSGGPPRGPPRGPPGVNFSLPSGGPPRGPPPGGPRRVRWKEEEERRVLEAERKMIIEAMGGRAKACPACGNVVEKHGGDHQVMCGCEAKPAGGTMEKALRGGGCGHQWSWKNGEPLGNGRPGHPINERQYYFRKAIKAD